MIKIFGGLFMALGHENTRASVEINPAYRLVDLQISTVALTS